jgi:hypothetical protein
VPSQPPADATIIGAPAQPGPSVPSQPPADATIIGAPAQAPQDATVIGAAPPVGGYPATNVPPDMPPAGLPPSAPPAKQSGGGNIWKVLAIIAGIGVLTCGALAIGVILVLNQLGGRVDSVFTSINSGLIATSIAAPTSGIPSDSGTVAEPTTAPASGAGTVVFQDDFEDPASSGFGEEDSETAASIFVDGAYEMTVKEPNFIVWRPIRGQHADVNMSVDVTFTGSELTAAGLLFRFQDSDNFYIFTISSDGRYGLDLYEGDNPTILIDWTETPAINPPGEVNALRVETVGDTIRLYANDQLLDEVSDGTFTRGRAAIAVNTFDTAGAPVRFDNLLIERAE